MTKTAALRIRIEPTLHQQFIDTCKAQDIKASEVLRDFMRQFVAQNAGGKQAQLFRENNK
ncbi:MAG: plasmid-related protein [Gammaproteobacteria bacterium]|nr:plasmid-related protein [Gammaproteobacteria bacterium]